MNPPAQLPVFQQLMQQQPSQVKQEPHVQNKYQQQLNQLMLKKEENQVDSQQYHQNQSLLYSANPTASKYQMANQMVMEGCASSGGLHSLVQQHPLNTSANSQNN
mmetsp:Transcript_4608/g.7814  ORF Transcript_4608/g.7814 Transcript_4608/m.7814 type:complete len:105 (-) Transcript_4608:392-706(-)